MKNLTDRKVYDLVLVDAMNFVSRSYHGIKLEYKGKKTGMLYGVTRLISTMRSLYPKAEVIFLWEGYGSWRKQKYPGYKKSRLLKEKDPRFGEAVREVKQCITWMGCVQISQYGIEADDLAGYFVYNASEFDQVLLVSNDEDWFQFLMSDGSVDIQRRDEVLTYAEIESTLGFPPDRIGIYKVLTGDTSDDISGITRFPKKLAADLAKSCDSLEDLTDSSLCYEKRFEKWMTAIRESGDLLRENFDLIIYNEAYVNQSNWDIVVGVPDKTKLKKLLKGNGMEKTIEKLSKQSYV